MESIPDGPTENNHRYKEIFPQDKSKGKVMLELFTWKVSQTDRLRTSTATRRSFLRNSIRRKHPEHWRRKNTTMPLHFALCLSKRSCQSKAVLPHPPYSSDLVPFSFSTSKKSYVGVDFSRPRRHKGRRTWPPCKYPSAVFPADVAPNGDYFRETVHMCKGMWVSCNMVRQNHSPRNYWL
jgi:hypothetical protein